MRCLAKLHSVDVGKLNLMNLQGKTVKMENKFKLMDRLKDAVKAIPEEYVNFPDRKQR